MTIYFEYCVSRSAGCGGFCQIAKHVLRNFLKTNFLTIIKLVVDKKYMPRPEFLKFLINYNDFNLLLLFIDAIILIKFMESVASFSTTILVAQRTITIKLRQIIE